MFEGYSIEYIDEIKKEIKRLERAKDMLGKALHYLRAVDWPIGIERPHHADMEMEYTLDEIQDEIDDIMQTLGGI